MTAKDSPTITKIWSAGKCCRISAVRFFKCWDNYIVGIVSLQCVYSLNNRHYKVYFREISTRLADYVFS